MPGISVIIPFHGRPQALRQTLQALAAQTLPADRFEVVVVDDGSTNGPPKVSGPWTYALTLRRQANRGPGAARNNGIRQSSGALCVFLDADMIPDAGLLQAYSEIHAAHPQAILVGRQRPWAPAFASRFDQLFNYVAIGDMGPRARPCAFYHLASGNFAADREALTQLGGFDEQLRMCEDTDLGYRAQQQGIILHYTPSATGYHNHPKTLAELCAWQQASAWWTAHLMHKHPAIAGQLPVYREVEPIAPGRDPGGLVLRKAARMLLAVPPLLPLMEWTVRVLELVTTSRPLLFFFYLKILTSYRLRGFRAGVRSLRQRRGGDV